MHVRCKFWRKSDFPLQLNVVQIADSSDWTRRHRNRPDACGNRTRKILLFRNIIIVPRLSSSVYVSDKISYGRAHALARSIVIRSRHPGGLGHRHKEPSTQYYYADKDNNYHCKGDYFSRNFFFFFKEKTYTVNDIRRCTLFWAAAATPAQLTWPRNSF